MEILKDEGGQGTAEYVLLFGAVIVLIVVGLAIYRAYFNTTPQQTVTVGNDISKIRQGI